MRQITIEITSFDFRTGKTTTTTETVVLEA